MFRKRINILFTALLCLVSVSLFGQDLEKDISEIAEAMKKASSVSIDVDIRVYAKKGGSVIYNGDASLTKFGKSTKSVLAEMEFVNTPTYQIRVDHEEKSVLIYRKQKATDANIAQTQQVEFDVEAIRKLIESENETTKKPDVRLISSNAGVKKYSIKGSPEISELLLEVDVTKNKILSVTMEYANGNSKGQYVVLDYSKFLYNSDVTSVFDMSNYFTENDTNYVLSPKLKGYHIYTEL